MTERQFAAGGVVIKKEKGELRVLLVKDSYGHWTWAKGHIEEGEAPEEAAVREIWEETGLKNLQIREELGKQEYSFSLNGKKIFKTVYIFLVESAAGEKLTVQTSELEDARWFAAEEAVETIEYEGSSDLVEKGIKIFRERDRRP
ncbi:NUDIX domain-containing protein [Candidatus Omnitrophota bacterium]